MLATTRKNGSPYASPVWFRWTGEAFEVVIARGDVKLRHLERDSRCSLLVFEAVPPFRGVEARGEATLAHGDVTEIRRSIAGRYLGPEGGDGFADTRKDRPGVLLQLRPAEPRVWDLAGLL